MGSYIATVGDETCRLAVRAGAAGVHIELDGVPHAVELVPWLGTTHFYLHVDGTSIPVVIRRRQQTVFVTIGPDRYAVQVGPDLPATRAVPSAGPAARAVPVVSPMPGRVVAVDVQPGEGIEQGRTVAVMEAMKMQMEIRTPASGRVQTIHVRPGEDVGGGTPLVTIEVTT